MTEQQHIPKASEILTTYSTATIDELKEKMPADISAELTILSSKLWEIGSKKLKAERAEAVKWFELRKTVETDAQANRAIKITDEYSEHERIKYAEKSCILLMRSLKSLLESKSNESKNYY